MENQNPVETAQNTVTEKQDANPAIPAAESEAPKRRRGRPPKNPTLNAENPGGTSGTASSGPKKRQTKMSGEQIGNLAKQIQGIHLIAATLTNLPEVALHDSEAELLANSVANMAAQYDLRLDGKTGAAIQLLATAAMIYTPRYFAIRNRMNRPVMGTVIDEHQQPAQN